MEFILSREIKCPKSGIFTNKLIISGWGASGKVILQVSIAVFFRGLLSKKFSGKDGSAPHRKKLARTPVQILRL